MRRLWVLVLVAPLLAVPVAGAIGGGWADDMPVEASARADATPELSGSVHIQGNQELRQSDLVDRGDGSASDPFVIEDLLDAFLDAYEKRPLPDDVDWDRELGAQAEERFDRARRGA